MKILVDIFFLIAFVLLCGLVFLSFRSMQNPSVRIWHRRMLTWFSVAILLGVCFVEGLIDTVDFHRNFYHDPAFRVHLFVFVIPFTVCLVWQLLQFAKPFRAKIVPNSTAYRVIEILMFLLYVGVLITGQGLLNKF